MDLHRRPCKTEAEIEMMLLHAKAHARAAGPQPSEGLGLADTSILGPASRALRKQMSVG